MYWQTAIRIDNRNSLAKFENTILQNKDAVNPVKNKQANKQNKTINNNNNNSTCNNNKTKRKTNTNKTKRKKKTVSIKIFAELHFFCQFCSLMLSIIVKNISYKEIKTLLANFENNISDFLQTNVAVVVVVNT